MLDLRNSYYKSINDMEELANYYGWNEEQIIQKGQNRNLLNNYRRIMDMGI